MSLEKIIPKDWGLINLSELTSLITKGTTPTTNGFSYLEDGVNFVKVESILSNGSFIPSKFAHVSDDCHDSFKRSQLNEGDILFTIAGALGRSAIVESYMLPANTNQAVAIIRLKNLKNKEYIFHYLRGDYVKNLIEKINVSTAQANLSLGQINKFKIPLPPFKEQQKIANILSTVDDKIEIINQQITETQELKKGLMQRLLSKGIGHTEFKDSTLGKIPLAWELKRLKDVADFSNGKGHEKGIDENGEFIVVNSKFISTDARVKKFSNQNLCPLKRNDITIVMSDIPNGKAIAKCFIIDEDNRYTLNQRIGSLTAKEDVNYKFLFYVLNRNRYYLAFDNGVGQTNLRKDEVINCPIPFPPIEEQQKIAEILSAVDEKLEVLSEKKTTYKELKKGLMQQLLTGLFRVRV